MWTSSTVLRLFTDARGFAAVFGSQWIQGHFPDQWLQVNIAIKELLLIVLATNIWGRKMANFRILCFTDNQSIVHVVNSQTSKEPLIMSLIRQLVMSTMKWKIDFKAKHIPGKSNLVADLLSRFQIQAAFQAVPWLKSTAEEVPQELLPWSTEQHHC